MGQHRKKQGLISLVERDKIQAQKKGVGPLHYVSMKEREDQRAQQDCRARIRKIGAQPSVDKPPRQKLFQDRGRHHTGKRLREKASAIHGFRHRFISRKKARQRRKADESVEAPGQKQAAQSRRQQIGQPEASLPDRPLSRRRLAFFSEAFFPMPFCPPAFFSVKPQEHRDLEPVHQRQKPHGILRFFQYRNRQSQHSCQAYG